MLIGFQIPIDFLKEIMISFLWSYFRPWGFGGSGYIVLLSEKNDADYRVLPKSSFFQGGDMNNMGLF